MPRTSTSGITIPLGAEAIGKRSHMSVGVTPVKGGQHASSYHHHNTFDLFSDPVQGDGDGSLPPTQDEGKTVNAKKDTPQSAPEDAMHVANVQTPMFLDVTVRIDASACKMGTVHHTPVWIRQVVPSNLHLSHSTSTSSPPTVLPHNAADGERHDPTKQPRQLSFEDDEVRCTAAETPAAFYFQGHPCGVVDAASCHFYAEADHTAGAAYPVVFPHDHNNTQVQHDDEEAAIAPPTLRGVESQQQEAILISIVCTGTCSKDALLLHHPHSVDLISARSTTDLHQWEPSVLHSSFSFIATLPLHGDDESLLHHLVAHPAAALRALQCSQVCLPFVAEKIEGVVHRSLIALRDEDATRLRYLAPLETLRSASVAVSAAFSHRGVSFLQWFFHNNKVGTSPSEATHEHEALLLVAPFLFRLLLSDSEFLAVLRSTLLRCSDSLLGSTVLQRAFFAALCWLRWGPLPFSSARCRTVCTDMVETQSDHQSIITLAACSTSILRSMGQRNHPVAPRHHHSQPNQGFSQPNSQRMNQSHSQSQGMFARFSQQSSAASNAVGVGPAAPFTAGTAHRQDIRGLLQTLQRVLDVLHPGLTIQDTSHSEPLTSYYSTQEDGPQGRQRPSFSSRLSQGMEQYSSLAPPPAPSLG